MCNLEQRYEILVIKVGAPLKYISEILPEVFTSGRLPTSEAQIHIFFLEKISVRPPTTSVIVISEVFIHEI